jgi:dienelactone hydrolase
MTARFGRLLSTAHTIALVVLAISFFSLAVRAADEQALSFDAKSVGAPNSGATLELWKPAGSGPFPAVVVLHGCDGVTAHHRSWAQRLVGWGYAAAIVDSLRPRHVKETCTAGGSPRPQLRAQDAFNAAAYLRTLPDIVPGRIGVVGFSHGGSTAVFTAFSSEVPTARGGQPFAAIVAYYPGCTSAPAGATSTDLLILSARDDDWTLAAPCVKMVDAHKGQPHAPEIKVYPVVHGFDYAFAPTMWNGHMMGSNPEAAADSYVRVETFFAAHLKAK